MSRGQAKRRYQRSVLLLSVAYVALLLSVSIYFEAREPSGPVAVALAVLPALPIIGIFVAIGRYLVDEKDEYLRSLLVRQTLWASAFALSIATVWGFLEGFEIVGHVEAFYVAVLWFGGLGVGSLMNRLTVGDSGGC